MCVGGGGDGRVVDGAEGAGYGNAGGLWMGWGCLVGYYLIYVSVFTTWRYVFHNYLLLILFLRKWNEINFFIRNT